MSAIRTHDLITCVDTDALEWEEVAPGARRNRLIRYDEASPGLSRT